MTITTVRSVITGHVIHQVWQGDRLMSEFRSLRAARAFILRNVTF